MKLIVTTKDDKISRNPNMVKLCFIEELECGACGGTKDNIYYEFPISKLEIENISKMEDVVEMFRLKMDAMERFIVNLRETQKIAEPVSAIVGIGKK